MCINFANEKLQAQFIEALVASQRAEYEAEGIASGTIDFPDNSDVLRLLEGKVGVLALLDEECTLPKGSGTLPFLSSLIPTCQGWPSRMW